MTSVIRQIVCKIDDKMLNGFCELKKKKHDFVEKLVIELAQLNNWSYDDSLKLKKLQCVLQFFNA